MPDKMRKNLLLVLSTAPMFLVLPIITRKRVEKSSIKFSKQKYFSAMSAVTFSIEAGKTESSEKRRRHGNTINIFSYFLIHRNKGRVKLPEFPM